MTHRAVAAGAVALGAALVLGSATAPGVLLVAVLLVQGVLLSGWHRSLTVPGAVAGSVVAGAAAVGADVVVLLGEGDRPLDGVPALLALAVVAALVQQLVRRDGRPALASSLASTVTLAVLAAMAAAFLAADAAEGGAPLVAAAAVPAALVSGASVLRRRLGGPGWLDLIAVPVLAVPVGLVVAAVSELETGPSLVVSLCAAGSAWVAGVLVARSPAPDAAVAASLPFALAGPVAYVLGRLLIG